MRQFWTHDGNCFGIYNPLDVVKPYEVCITVPEGVKRQVDVVVVDFVLGAGPGLPGHTGNTGHAGHDLCTLRTHHNVKVSLCFSLKLLKCAILSYCVHTKLEICTDLRYWGVAVAGVMGHRVPVVGGRHLAGVVTELGGAGAVKLRAGPVVDGVAGGHGHVTRRHVSLSHVDIGVIER